MIVAGEEAFRAFLQRRTGFVMPEDRWRFLAPRFLGRLGDRGFRDVEAFVRYLEHDPRGRTELEEIYNILTVRKTSFFRNPSTFAALERDVLPPLLRERRAHLPVSIWSAGCSTGEEAYSLAMVASQVLGGGEQGFHVLASDIVKEALTRARQGAYSEASAQEVPASYRRFLRQVGGLSWVDERVREKVEFAAHNLVHDPAPRPATGAWDVIFCRNVLIYFSLEQARQIIERFAHVLAPGGALFLGSAEVFFDMEPDYEVVFWGDTLYDRRRVEARASTRPELDLTPLPADDAVRAARRPSERTPAAPDPGDVPGDVTRAAPRPHVDTPTRPMPRASERFRALSDSGRVVRPRTESGRRPSLSESGRWRRPSDASRRGASSASSHHDAPTARIQGGTGDTPTRAFSRGWPSNPALEPPDGDGPVDDTRADLRVAGALPHDQVLEAERRLDADDRDGAARALRAAITRAPRWARPRVLLARVYLRAGEVDHAVRQLETAAEVEPLDPRAHYLLGKLRLDQGDAARAEESLRRALYVDPDFLVARWSLARVFEQAGRADRACKELRTVMRGLRNGAARTRDALDGFSTDDLSARCEAAISALGGRLDESGDDLRRLL